MDLPEFLTHLRRSRLLASAELEEMSRRAAGQPPPAVTELGELLVQAGRLSRYQLDKLLAGRSHGLVLGPFEILARLGKGGMASVFLARNKDEQRLVAVKLVTPRQQQANPILLERLRRELHFSERVQHPHIVPVYSLTEHHGVHCLALEFIIGSDLHHDVRHLGPLPWLQASKLLGQVALALEEVHRRGVVHTDVKPGNILLAQGSGTLGLPVNGQPVTIVGKLIDFGLAIDLQEPERNDVIRQPGRIAGTFAYAAPEQTRSSRQVGPEADLYALGGTMFFALTGRPPFPGGSSRDKIRRVRSDPAPRLSELGLVVPRRLDDLVHQLLEKKPGDRPRTAALVADVLLGLKG
ncbi:MAG TPA: serine/threonine-protein kinase [Gemmatales bacterium]|nr:serine/threonine-protein kinase [Gemmatales bacterium]